MPTHRPVPRSTTPCHLLGAAALLALSTTATHGEPSEETIQQVALHTGEMVMPLDVAMAAGAEPSRRESLVFEPWQMLPDLSRSDIVLLMRHGPTDWSKRDPRGVAPDDCAAQRVLSEAGSNAMRDLGAILGANGLRPGSILVSEWCRGRQTLDRMMEGFELIDAAPIPMRVEPAASLLLSLGGPPDVARLRELVSSWDGGADEGPLLVVTHFTNIAEMTNFHVFEGEMLVLDPSLDSRVLGYLRLRSAGPDVGHFDVP